MATRATTNAVLIAVAALISPLAGAHAQSGDAEATERALNTDFSFCEERDAPNERDLNRVNLSADDVAESLDGVWVGMRYTPEGKLDNADYIMSFNMESLEHLVYEERGDGVPTNKFVGYFEEALQAPGATTLTYLYCGGNEFGVFRDVFTRVSANPDDIIAPLREVTGLDTLQPRHVPPKRFTSIATLWESLKEAGYFETRAGEDTQVNAALNTLSVLPYQYGEERSIGVRLDFVGELRGSPNKGHTPGKPVANVEGGIFAGLATDEGIFLDSFAEGVEILCFCQLPPSGLLSADTPTPFDRFRYDQVVIGPLR